jgi:hypothetical protein
LFASDFRYLLGISRSSSSTMRTAAELLKHQATLSSPEEDTLGDSMTRLLGGDEEARHEVETALDNKEAAAAKKP